MTAPAEKPSLKGKLTLVPVYQLILITYDEVLSDLWCSLLY